MSVFDKIGLWFRQLALTFRDEMNAVVSDAGVLLFFVALPLAYPVVYTVIYNPEEVREMPFAVVDHCRSQESRELVRMCDATSAMSLYDYASDLAEAKTWMADAKVYGILEIPSDYSQNINTARQANVSFFAEMSLLLRYRAFLSALTDIQLATGAKITQHRLNTIGLVAQRFGGNPVETQTNFLGDTQQGFASFIMPGIVVLILQQSMVLGICMLGGTARERRRKGFLLPYDRLYMSAAPSAAVLGRVMCYAVIYIPMTLYILHYIPEWFNLPHQGSPVDYLLFIFPFILASACFGVMLSYLMHTREDCFLWIVFTSVVFLFLSGLTWPRFAMNGLWHSLADCVPATWGVEGFVRINSNGATLAEESSLYLWLWGLCIVYFAASCLILRLRRR